MVGEAELTLPFVNPCGVDGVSLKEVGVTGLSSSDVVLSLSSICMATLTENELVASFVVKITSDEDFIFSSTSSCCRSSFFSVTVVSSEVSSFLVVAISLSLLLTLSPLSAFSEHSESDSPLEAHAIVTLVTTSSLPLQFTVFSTVLLQSIGLDSASCSDVPPTTPSVGVSTFFEGSGELFSGEGVEGMISVEESEIPLGIVSGSEDVVPF